MIRSWNAAVPAVPALGACPRMPIPRIQPELLFQLLASGFLLQGVR
jgi:hypothetical protein